MFHETALALTITRDAMTREAHSALPWAPVQPARPAPVARTARTRSALADALHRAAHVVSPA
jgi:hypothetical protein